MNPTKNICVYFAAEFTQSVEKYNRNLQAIIVSKDHGWAIFSRVSFTPASYVEKCICPRFFPVCSIALFCTTNVQFLEILASISGG
jgi:hypothetical protein